MKRLISKRNLDISLYEEEKGSVLCEATLLDPYHLIRFQMRVDPNSGEILHCLAEMTRPPHKECVQVEDIVRHLVGHKIIRGIRRVVAEVLGGGRGCVHLSELVNEAINFVSMALLGYGEGRGLVSGHYDELSAEERLAIGKKYLPDTCLVFSREESE